MKIIRWLVLLSAIVVFAVFAAALHDGVPDTDTVLAQCELDALDGSHGGAASYLELCMRAAGYERLHDNPGCQLPEPRDATVDDQIRALIRGEAGECYSPVTATGRFSDWWHSLLGSAIPV